MRALALIISLLLPGIVLAEPVIVRSGEHADFSRLAFRFSGPVDWEMGRVEAGYELRLKGSDSTLDISDVYLRISRDRIAGIKVSEDHSRVSLILACDCYADAFEFRPGLLVVDIKEGAPPSASKFENRFAADEISPQTADDSTQIPVVNIEPSAVKPPGSAPVKIPVSLPLLTQQPEQHSPPRVGIFALPETKEAQALERAAQDSERIAEMQSEMLAQISRAASQGLLQADVDLPKPIMEMHRETAELPTVRDTAPAVESVQEHLNIHVESSIDRDLGNSGVAELLTQSGGECLQSKVFDLAHWGNPDAVTEQITLERTGLVGEFDKVNSEAVKKLVQAYIYAGFGAEAQQVLQAFDADLKYAGLYRAMAQIVDKGWAVPDSMLKAQAGCDSAAALWAVLAAKKLSKGMVINHQSVLAAFSELPLHLRKHLGPKLSQKFLDIDDRQTATALRNAVARATGEAGPEFRLLEARLDQQRGRHDVAEEALETIVSEDSALAPEALARLLQTKIERNHPVDAGLIVSAEAFIFIQQGTKISADLQHLIAQAFGRSGNYPAATKALRTLEGSEFIDTKRRGKAWADVLTSALAEGDQTFTKFIFATKNDLRRQPIARAIRREAADRLLQNRFAEMAIQILVPPTRPTADDRLLLARAAVLQNRPEAALKWATDIVGSEASLIRAQAYEMDGKSAQAALEYGLIPDQIRQQDILWRAGDWRRLQRVENNSVQAAAQIMLLQQGGYAEKLLDDAGIIAQDQQLLDTSQATRASIEAILKSFPPVPQEGS